MTDTESRILQEIHEATRHSQDWQALDLQAHSIHIAVMSEPFLSYVFNGKKTVESRFSLHRIAPYQKVETGDVVCMKAGAIVGCFTVAWVRYFDLTIYPIADIAARYNEVICGNPTFWQRKADKRYATLMGITNAHMLPPVKISKKDRRAWLSLSPGHVLPGDR